MKNTILKIAQSIERHTVQAEDGLEKLKVIARVVLKKIWTRFLFLAVRVVKPTRPYLERSKVMTELYFIAAFFLVLCLISQKIYFASQVFLFLGVSATGLGFAIDTRKFVINFSRKSFLVKLLYGSVTLAISYVALSASKHIAHEITQIDPKFFSEFLGFMTVVITWFFSLLAIQIGVGLWGLTRFLLVIFFMFFLFVIRIFFASFTSRVLDLHHFLWRLFTNKKGKLSFSKLLYFAYCDLVGSLAIVFLIATPSHFIPDFSGKVKNAITSLLVLMEYRNDSRCAEAKGKEVAYLDKSLISVAEKVNDKYVFTIASCEYKK
jgi:hypothetical protein